MVYSNSVSSSAAKNERWVLYDEGKICEFLTQEEEELYNRSHR
jgi:hypothetical protein